MCTWILTKSLQCCRHILSRLKTQILTYRHYGPLGHRLSLCTVTRWGQGARPTLTQVSLPTGRPAGTPLAVITRTGRCAQAPAGEHLKNQGEREKEGRAFGDSSALPGKVSPPKEYRSLTDSGAARKSALCQGSGPTHLHKIKAGQEGDAVLDHFALWPLLRRHPGRLPGPRPPPGEVCTAQPKRAASSSRKRLSPLMSRSPRAPLEPALCVQRPRLLPAPLCSNPAVPGAGKSSFSPALALARVFLARDVQLPPPSCCCNGSGSPSLPWLSPPWRGSRTVGD